MTESFAAHDRAGRVKAGAHDSVTLCCVATKEAMCVRQRNLVATNLDSDEKKKKKDPRKLRRHSFVSKPRFINT